MPQNAAAKTGGDSASGSEPPRNREDVMQQDRDRRIEEPAMAPLETDGEAGNVTGRYAGQPVPKDENGNPRDPVQEATNDSDPADIPAGPGDAGAQRSPRTLPEEMQHDRGGWRRVAVILGIGAVILLVMVVIA